MFEYIAAKYAKHVLKEVVFVLYHEAISRWFPFERGITMVTALGVTIIIAVILGGIKSYNQTIMRINIEG